MKYFFGLIFLFCSTFLFAQSNNYSAIFSSTNENKWVDSLMNKLTLEQKAGQLFMIAAYSNKDETHYAEIEKYIRTNGIGGLIFMQGDPVTQANLTNRFQSASNIPLMLAMDAEWGPSMRISNTITYPRQMVLGALEGDSLVYAFGAEAARQLKRLGVHISFSPVVDVNNNVNNPVINDRSFGEQVNNVIQKSIAYMKGLQDNKILACAKHFPGHGDTDTDSHLDMPIIKHTKSRLDTIELKPFRALSEAGVGSMMVAHLSIPALDTTKNLPSTLSKPIITDLLRIKIGFQGLIFTDALNMKGITKFYPSGIAEVKALLAGDDVLLFSDNVQKAIDGVVKAVKDSIISEDMLNAKVRKILTTKLWLGLDKPQFVDTNHLIDDLNTDAAKYLKEEILTKAVTLVSNKDNLLPIKDLDKQKLATITIGVTTPTPFVSMLNNYAGFQHFYITKTATTEEFSKMLYKLKDFSTVVVNAMDMSRFAAKNFGLTPNEIAFVNKVQAQNKTVLVLFGTPYSLSKFNTNGSIIVANTQDEEAQKAAAQVIMGGRSAQGKLPVSAGAFKAGTGIATPIIRLGYGSPIEFSMDEMFQKKIDAIISDAIDRKVFPGCQLLVVKDGIVFYNKSFGKLTYAAQDLNVNKNTLFDLASVTKITASAPMLMKMVDENKLDINSTLSTYYHMDDSINKKNLTVKEILAHQSGLAAWIPFYKYTKDSLGNYDSTLYRKKWSKEYSYRINDNLFIRNDRVDTIYYDILNSSLKEKTYRYSDMGYYLFKKIIEDTYKNSLDRLTDSLFWKPLGCNFTTYNPRKKGWNYKEIAPTEEDDYFRYCTVQGDVHDPGAAMLGGVGGHAGLFSNANDMAKYMQMLLNNGVYGGRRYLNSNTISLFTAQAFQGNRRGLCFDKPALNGDSPAAMDASSASFGHTGFTGTIVWADPKTKMVFIFLSNRSYPNADNNKLAKENIRPRLQQIFYDALINR